MPFHTHLEVAMSAVTAKAVSWTELGYVPDSVIRAGIRRLLESKRREIHSGDVEFAANAMNRNPLGPVAKEQIRLAPHLAAAFALTSVAPVAGSVSSEIACV